MTNDDEEFITTPYRKKSKRRPPKKANHKHESADCIVTIGKCETHQAKYCPICGKIMDIRVSWDEKWRVPSWDGLDMWTNYARQQLDEETRTIPFFEIEDIFQKFVTFENKGEEK